MVRDMVEGLVIIAKGDVVEVSDLGVLRSSLAAEPTNGLISPPAAQIPAEAAVPSALGDFETLALAREDFERRYIAKKHEACKGNMSRTAEALGVERSYLYKKMKALGLIAPKKTGDSDPEAA